MSAVSKSDKSLSITGWQTTAYWPQKADPLYLRTPQVKNGFFTFLNGGTTYKEYIVAHEIP